MFSRWISASDAAPMPIFTTRPRIESRSPSRCRRVRTFESFTLRMSLVSGVSVPHELDFLDARGVDHEGALDSDTARNPAHGDLLVDAAVTHAEHGPLEVLKALAVPFDDPHANAHGVSGPDLGQIGLQLLSGKRVQEVVHRNG